VQPKRNWRVDAPSHAQQNDTKGKLVKMGEDKCWAMVSAMYAHSNWVFRSCVFPLWLRSVGFRGRVQRRAHAMARGLGAERRGRCDLALASLGERSGETLERVLRSALETT